MALLNRNKPTGSPQDAAARKSTGTSYSAKGHLDANSVPMGEVGSAYFGQIPDPVPELSNQVSQIRTYTSMVRGDVSVSSSLRCGEGPILGGDYSIEPYDETPESAAIREFVEWQVFGASQPWLTTLSQILKMFRYGFQVFEPVWENREWAPSRSTPGANRRIYTSLKRLAVRPVSTITDIEYDDYGDLTQIKQNAIISGFNTKEVIIPANKLLVFTFQKDGSDIRGDSILRPAYPHWYMKNKFYSIDGIQKEHHGMGMPKIKLLAGWTAKDRRFANKLGKAMRVNEQGYILETDHIEVGYAELKGNLTNALESAVHHDMMIMKNILVQFLAVDSAGRATAATAMDMMLKAMRYIANYICDQINYYLIPQMVAYNFNTDQFPKLCVRNVGETKDLQMWASAMSNLINAEAIEVDDDTENWIRRVVDMPKRSTPRSEFGPRENRRQLLLQGSLTPGSTGATSTQSPTKGTSGATGQVLTGNVGKSPSSGA